MKKALMALAVLALAGCAKPYGPTDKIYNPSLVKADASKQQTQIKLLRLTQFRDSIYSFCVFDVAVDGKDVASLEQNKYVTLYVDNGTHYLSYSYSCDRGTPRAQKVLEVIANGTPQEYSSKITGYGELAMWRTL